MYQNTTRTEEPKGVQGPGELVGESFMLLLIGSGFTPFFALLGAGPAMLALGILHNTIRHHVPALGFWGTTVILWGVPTLVGMFARPLTAGRSK